MTRFLILALLILAGCDRYIGQQECIRGTYWVPRWNTFTDDKIAAWEQIRDGKLEPVTCKESR